MLLHGLPITNSIMHKLLLQVQYIVLLLNVHFDCVVAAGQATGQQPQQQQQAATTATSTAQDYSAQWAEYYRQLGYSYPYQQQQPAQQQQQQQPQQQQAVGMPQQQQQQQQGMPQQPGTPQQPGMPGMQSGTPQQQMQQMPQQQQQQPQMQQMPPIGQQMPMQQMQQMPPGMPGVPENKVSFFVMQYSMIQIIKVSGLCHFQSPNTTTKLCVEYATALSMQLAQLSAHSLTTTPVEQFFSSSAHTDKKKTAD